MIELVAEQIQRDHRPLEWPSFCYLVRPGALVESQLECHVLCEPCEVRTRVLFLVPFFREMRRGRERGDIADHHSHHVRFSAVSMVACCAKQAGYTSSVQKTRRSARRSSGEELDQPRFSGNGPEIKGCSNRAMISARF